MKKNSNGLSALGWGKENVMYLVFVGVLGLSDFANLSIKLVTTPEPSSGSLLIGVLGSLFYGIYK